MVQRKNRHERNTMQDNSNSREIYDIPVARIITDAEWAALEESFEKEMNR